MDAKPRAGLILNLAHCVAGFDPAVLACMCMRFTTATFKMP